MKFLFIGDIVGRPGRTVVKKLLPDLRKELTVDFVIANVENLSHGKGITKNHIEEMEKAGVDFFTGGNHSFAKEEGFPLFDDKKFKIVRPLNFPSGTPGKGFLEIVVGKKKILLINLIGNINMGGTYDRVFSAVDEVLKKFSKKKFDVTVVDFHAETTAEKYTMRHFLDGRVSVLLGTHTHVPTADAHITDKGMGYITDVGMTGAVDSSIGVKSELTLQKQLTQLPVKFEPEDKDPYYLRAVYFEVEKGKCKGLELIQVKMDG